MGYSGVFFLFVAGIVTVASGVEQSVRVKGLLTCDGTPYTDARIKIYDQDTYTFDDKLAEATTDANGFFDLQGSGDEDEPITFKYNIYHRCGMNVHICWYKSSWKIPANYVNVGGNTSKIYDAQETKLEMLKKDRDCFNFLN
ncbi:unnamed protein product, partial [Mesorhabditis spiculigera]